MRVKDVEDANADCNNARMISTGSSTVTSTSNKHSDSTRSTKPQENANAAADAEYQAALEKVGKSPSKSSIRKGKKSNRETEKTLMDHGTPIIAPEAANTETEESEQTHVDSKPIPLPKVMELPPVRVTPTPEPVTEDTAPTTAPLLAKNSVFARIVQSRQTEVSHA